MGTLVQLTGAAWSGRCATLCLQAACDGWAAGRSGQWRKRIRDVYTRWCAIQIDNLCLFTTTDATGHNEPQLTIPDCNDGDHDVKDKEKNVSIQVFVVVFAVSFPLFSHLVWLRHRWYLHLFVLSVIFVAVRSSFTSSSLSLWFVARCSSHTRRNVKWKWNRIFGQLGWQRSFCIQHRVAGGCFAVNTRPAAPTYQRPVVF